MTFETDSESGPAQKHLDRIIAHQIILPSELIFREGDSTAEDLQLCL
jgi:hypothetical protein